jgi:tetratricopeptide (TPR) repeat protein
MNSKTKIKTFFDSKQENAQYIEKYEENIDFFNNLLKVGHKEDIEFVIPIKMYHYADPLNQTGNYSKALTILTEIETDIERLKGQSKQYNQFLESVTFLKGVCLARLKKYKESNKEFSKILKKNPNNDRYIDWYKSNKKNEIDRLSWAFLILGLGYYFVVLILQFSGHRIENIIFREIGLATALLSFLGSFVWKKLIDKQTIKLK